MARLFFCGAESGNNLSEGLTSGGWVITCPTTAPVSGARHFAIAGTGEIVAVGTQMGALSTGVRYYGSAWMQFRTTLPASNCVVMRWNASAAAACSVQLTTGGKLQLLNQAGTQIGSDSAATISVNTWYLIQLGIEINSGSTDYAECKLDGTSVASTTTGGFSDSAPDSFRCGHITTPGASRTYWIDDMIVNSNAGGVNDSWPTSIEKVVLLSPTADDTINNWVAGAGSGSNLWEAVNNAPPVGVDTASATNTSQIENSVSAANNGYRATMATYTSAGITSSDTVTAVYAVAEGANDSTTGTDTIDVGTISNPAIAQVSQSIDVNDGTFPTGWNYCRGTVADAPSVTLGTAPVMIVEKNVATTRVNTVCYMGMYVSYTVNTAPPASGRGPQVIFIT